VTGDWRRQHNEVFRYPYSSPNVIRVNKLRRMRWAGHVARTGKMINSYKTSFLETEGKRLLGRPQYRWEDNIRMDLRGIEWEGVDWIHLA
jgi:hypothetical protein